MRFDLTTLKLFVSVIDHGSITKAAESAHLVPSAASKRIADLEAQLGFALLVRRHAGVVPTPAGQALDRHAREVLKALERIPASVGAIAAAEQPEIRIAANQTAVVVMVADLEHYIDRRPGVRIRLEEGSSPAIIEAVANGGADLGVIGHYQPVDRLNVVPYRSIPLVLVVAAVHPLAGREAISFAEVLEFDLISFVQGSAIHSWTLEAATHMARKPRISMQVTSYEAMRAMVHARLGIAVIPAPNILPFKDLFNVHVLPLTDDWACMQLYLIYARDAARSPALDDLVAQLTTAGHAPRKRSTST
ncbi:MAG: LysR family transcriptional regulator [Burkholderiaceae bacterium]|nr:LysR family transcriptional regulator [Burkholderiaceae bacterium]